MGAGSRHSLPRVGPRSLGSRPGEWRSIPLVTRLLPLVYCVEDTCRPLPVTFARTWARARYNDRTSSRRFPPYRCSFREFASARRIPLLLRQPPLPAFLPTERDGDRVVLIRKRSDRARVRWGYWEAALTAQCAGKAVRFRNLGWSGDNVFGEAQAGFGTVADGFRHLKDHVLALKPTVIVVGYGTNESYEGPAGVTKFINGLNVLLDTLKPTNARFVLLSPLKQEAFGRPLPDPEAQNRNLRLYTDAIKELAVRRGITFVNLFDLPTDAGTSSGPPHRQPGSSDSARLLAYGDRARARPRSVRRWLGRRAGFCRQSHAQGECQNRTCCRRQSAVSGRRFGAAARSALRSRARRRRDR